LGSNCCFWHGGLPFWKNISLATVCIAFLAGLVFFPKGSSGNAFFDYEFLYITGRDFLSQIDEICQVGNENSPTPIF
jgi:hypothetical protein